MYRIGLTGGVGSGKSTVSSYMKEFGIPVIDGDCHEGNSASFR